MSRAVLTIPALRAAVLENLALVLVLLHACAGLAGCEPLGAQLEALEARILESAAKHRAMIARELGEPPAFLEGLPPPAGYSVRPPESREVSRAAEWLQRRGLLRKLEEARGSRAFRRWRRRAEAAGHPPLEYLEQIPEAPFLEGFQVRECVSCGRFLVTPAAAAAAAETTAPSRGTEVEAFP